MGKANTSTKRKGELLQAYGFITPTVIILGTFVLFSVLYSLFISFTRVNLLGEVSYKFVGFDNYINLLKDERIWIAFKNTISYVIVVVPTQTFIALVLAYVLNQKLKAKNLIRTVLFLPTLTSSAVLTMIFMFLFSVNGPINQFLMSSGIMESAVNFLGDPKFALKVIMAMNIWSTVPFFMTIYLAGLQDIPDALYEAASIDGANSMQKFFKITVPNIAPVTVFVVLQGLIGCFQIFDQAYIFSNGSGGPQNSTLTVALSMYQYAFKTNGTMGYAAAIAVVLAIVIFIVAMLAKKLQKEEI
ncbi:carbohydrate ABC transporter permease [Romboutsia lituseburensis]|uniref:Carbohydrate ABC transporter membrane protein 1, CUT1 family n=1 Tax=Romboutsia lituseburensis DSM 797 TaxID=1121325 RepID=A0A1G9I0W4_9FIRM|nr:sugar ABC transporter permease [Romboutsia lituseburensis]CEH34102.1 Lactose transport system permease protein LacF [Romboutsia lituseburensis]SDL18564.1 carbohydrate ABC transporter membrane protein 1, CUT1 family [Romboutsia lituseburensis DSM 797]